ncbi:MAG: diguanylate cyclase [Syntrophomonadaceae bacterium]|nr:diguanylate cyclase [Syntrophomonadaceae bacterium]
MRFSSAFYQSILDNMANAYGYYHIITNDAGQPSDFEFIQVNPAMEKLMGQSAVNLIGKTVNEVEPEFVKNNPDLIKLFGEVAAQRITRCFEYYFSNSKKWYFISTYSPQPGFFVTIFNDVTALKKSEQELRESEARWKYALEGAGDGVLDYDIANSTIYYSPQWKAMLGYNDEDITNSLYEWLCRLHPSDVLRVQHEITNHLQDVNPYFSSEYRMRCKDGTYKWFLGRGMIVARDQFGTPLRMIGTNTDISRAKAADEAILQHQDNLMAFFNGVDSLLFVINSNGEIREANQPALETLGYTLEELRGNNIFDLQPLDDKTEGTRFLQSVIAGRKFNRTLTLVSKNRDKSISVDVRIVPGPWNGENALFAVCRDITPLHLSEAKFFKAFHISPGIMSITTLEEGRFIDVNNSFCQKLEHNRKEALGRTSKELNIYEDIAQRDEFIDLLKEKGCVRDYETIILSKTGQRVIALLSADIIRIGTDSYLLINANDITERRRMESELERKNQELEQLNQVLLHQVNTDDLTGIYNHRFIVQRLREEVERADRYHLPLSIMMLDLDHFKKINDRFGHPTGDIVLNRVAQTIKQTLRQIDIAGRYGGEEFLVILPQTSVEDAVQVAERILEQVAAITLENAKPRITISIGVAAFSDENENELLARADRLLYLAKANGRNRVEY